MLHVKCAPTVHLPRAAPGRCRAAKRVSAAAGV
jgi:hypothetical protein